MGKKIPGPRRPEKIYRCSWCDKPFSSAFRLGHHVNSCKSNPSNCKHPKWRRKKTYSGKITIGTKRYKTYKVTCKRCGKYIENATKEIK